MMMLRSSISPAPSNMLLLLMLLTMTLMIKHSLASSNAVLTIVDSNFVSSSYRAEIAPSGNPLSRNRLYGASLMTPPQSSSSSDSDSDYSSRQLCEFPSSLLSEVHSETNETIMLNASEDEDKDEDLTLRTPVALLVSLGGCEPHKKVQVALEIQQNVSKALKFIIFYNNDIYQTDEIVPWPEFYPDPNLKGIAADDAAIPQSLLQTSIGLVSVSTVSGTDLLARIELLAVAINASPEFLSKKDDTTTTNNTLRHWQLPMLLERVTTGNDTDSYMDRGTGYSDARVYWFRFVLLTALIICPCCRAGYFWWIRGGRIRFRRDPERNGRIVGLQYIPPMLYWFDATNGAQGEDGTSITGRLTEEQVMALPEILYIVMSPTNNDDIDNNNNNNNNNNEKEGSNDDPDKSVGDSKAKNEVCAADTTIVVSSGSADDNHDRDQDALIEKTLGTTSTTTTSTTTTSTAATTTNSPDEERPAERTTDDSETETDNNMDCIATTTCTSCSICIDEFEAGERIRLLPRCRHAFHTECILPWLVERQGNCPLCKSSVLEPEEEGVEEGDEGDDVPTSGGREPSDDYLFEEETNNDASIHHALESPPISQVDHDGEDTNAETTDTPAAAAAADTPALWVVEDSESRATTSTVVIDEGPVRGSGQGVHSEPV